MPMLVIVHGVPAAGKTTLVKRLKQDLGLPSAGKDDIKEPLYETIGAINMEEKMLLGRAAIEMLYVLAHHMLASGRSMIIESAFFPKFANKDIAELIARHNAHAVQVYCKIDPVLAKERFIARNESGKRHKGHNDHLHYAMLDDPAFWRQYAP